MVKKAKAKKAPEKKAKKSKESKVETSEAHQKEHGPDVKRLLEEYEQKEKDLVDEDEFISQHMDMDGGEEGEF